MNVPHDLDAEAAALGAALLSRIGRDTLLASLGPEDFYAPRHQALYRVIARLHATGSAVDQLTVAREMDRDGALDDAGGKAWLREVEAHTPVSMNAASYCAIVADLAARRRLIAVTGEMREQASDPNVDLGEMIARLEHVGDVVRIPSSDVEPAPTAGALAALAATREARWLVPDFIERQDRLGLTGFEGAGKALDVDTPVATPDGWTTIGELTAGDRVFGPDGAPIEVLAVGETMTNRPCFSVRFSDGATVVADAEHEWLTWTLRARESDARQRRRGETKARGTDQRHKRQHFPAVVTTAEMAESLWAREGHARNHSIPVCDPLDLPERVLPVDPYTLGAWLGDGSRGSGRLASADVEIVERIAAAGWAVKKYDRPYAWGIGAHTVPVPSSYRTAEGMRVRGMSLAGRLRRLGVLHSKRIPAEYLRASIVQRLDLMRGLMDTDGTVDTRGACEFSVTDCGLASDFVELALSLGIKCRMVESDAVLNGRVVGRRFRITFFTHLPVFALERKACRLFDRPTARSRHRYVVAVDRVDSVPVRCIQVEGGLFLAGRDLIPTHNSTMLRQWAVQLASGIHPWFLSPIDPLGVLFVDLQDTEIQAGAAFSDLIARAGDRYRDDLLHVRTWREGIDLRNRRDFGRVDRLMEIHQPDVLIIGPHYKCYKLRGGERSADEQPAIECSLALDELLARHDAALFLEMHSPHGDGGDRAGLRPFGPSLWLRWPEFGLGLKPQRGSGGRTVDVVEWRGARDRKRTLPRKFVSSGKWPWSPLLDGEE